MNPELETLKQLIQATHPLENWWRASEGNTANISVELVEKNDEDDRDSYGYGGGSQSMIFKIGDRYFKLEATYSSFDDPDWDYAACTEVKQKVRTVSYYE